MSADQSWQAPWHVTVHDPWVPPPVHKDRAIRLRDDAVAGGLTAAFAVLFGPVLGLVWTAVAPKLSVARAVAGEEQAFKAQIGADVWFLCLAFGAGLITAAVAVFVFRARGPGLVVGLAVGGLIAAFVADRVGYLVDHASTLSALHAAGYRHPTALGVSLLDFKVRALGVVTAWPVAAVVTAGVVEMIPSRRR